MQSEEEINCRGRRKYYSAFFDTDDVYCISTASVLQHLLEVETEW
jgi:hypothetical protein